MFKKTLLISAVLFISFSTSAHDVICGDGHSSLRLDVHSGHAHFSSCHSGDSHIRCHSHGDGWHCESCDGTTIKVKRVSSCDGGSSWKGKIVNNRTGLRSYLQCREERGYSNRRDTDNDW